MHRNIAIVILNFNGEKDTVDCLKSLDNLILSNIFLSVIVVDNGSEKEFRIQSTRFRNKITVIRSDENTGFTGGNNIGMQHALKHGADYIMLLNNDTVVDGDLVLELLAGFEDKRAGVTVPKIYFAKGYEYHNKYEKKDLGRIIWYAGGIMDWENVIGYHRGVDEVDCGQFDKIEAVDFASGCCMMIKREVLETVRLFDNRYFLYYEESDLCMRIKRAKYSILYMPRAILWHKNAQSAGGAGSTLQDYYITRNRLLFGLTYARLRTKIALLREALRLLIAGRKWQKRGASDYFLKKFGKGSYKI